MVRAKSRDRRSANRRSGTMRRSSSSVSEVQSSSISPFVFARVWDRANPNIGALTTHMYFVRQPYCAFLEYTYKPNMLSPVFGMLRRMKSGYKRAQINFRILPKELTGGEYLFNIVSYPKIYGTTGTAKIIDFNKMDYLTEEEDKLMDTVADELGSPKDLILAKMRIVKTLIFDNEDLVHEIYELNKKFEMINIKEVEKVKKTPRKKRETFGQLVDEASAKKPDETVGLVSFKFMIINNLLDTTRRGAKAMFGSQEGEDEFLQATENQNESVRKLHPTNHIHD